MHQVAVPSPTPQLCSSLAGADSSTDNALQIGETRETRKAVGMMVNFRKSLILCSHSLSALARRGPAFAFPLQSFIEAIQFFFVGLLERTMAFPEVRRLRLLVFPVLEERSSRSIGTRIIPWWQRDKLPVNRRCPV
jgi:hypothetical protein